MGSDTAGFMDDTGFRPAFETGTAAATPRDVTGRVRRPAPGRHGSPRAWAASGAVLAGHALFFATIGLNSGTVPSPATRPPAMIYLDLTPPPAPRGTARAQTQPSAPAAAAAAPTAPPLPVTPRPARSEVAPPPRVAPLPAPPQPTPAPRPQAAATATQAAPGPAAAPTQASAPSPEFQRRVLAALERVRRYPPAARARREEGVAVVSFTMNRSGRVLSASVQQSSGSAALDRAALETVRRAALPAVPETFADPLKLVVPVEFSLGAAG